MGPADKNLTVICGGIGKAIRHQNQSLTNKKDNNNNNNSKEDKLGENLEIAMARYDYETQSTLINDLQSDCDSILSEMEEWKR